MIKTITTKDYEKAVLVAECEENKIPSAHNRIREEVFYKSLADQIKKCKCRKFGKNAKYVFTYSRNQGTSKYPSYVTAVSVSPIYGTEKETEKTFDGIRKCNILCFIKK